MRSLFVIFILCMVAGSGWAQPRYAADSWQQVKARGSGAITVLWHPIEPLVYENAQGKMAGLEYEIMQSFVAFAEKRYGVRLQVNWVQAGSFVQVYEGVSNAQQAGLFGWSYFSITEERRKEVQFTPAYMPDWNVLITHHATPVFASVEALATQLPSMRGYTVAGTTMEEDLLRVRSALYPALPVHTTHDDYAMMERIAADPGGMGYVPMPVYIFGIQKGYKVKRQHMMPSGRNGFAGIMPKNSDWQEVMEAYFASTGYNNYIQGLLHKYFGPEITALVMEIAEEDSLQATSSIELLSLEKEIVTRKLMDETIELQRQKWLRNMTLVVMAMLLVIAGILYNRFRIKQRLTHEMEQRNKTILEQSRFIEKINRQLRLKILQTRLNPHFLFNSLNAIQYFVMSGDRQQTMQYINRFSKFLRNVIRLADEMHISLEEEAAVCNQYLWLEQRRFPDRFDYEVSIQPHTGFENQVPPFMTLSLIEEALYRLLVDEQPKEKGHIRVLFHRMDSTLYIDVWGNGNHTGAGAWQEENVLHRRLEILNESASRKISLQEIPAAEHTDMHAGKRLVIPQPVVEDTCRTNL